MKILAIDSATKCTSVCVAEDFCIKAEFFLNTTFTHSETLAPMIKSLLENSRIGLSDIDLFAVSSGPGSFTGIRIGMAIIKGIAFAQDKPCLAVSSLEALAYNLIDNNCIACPVINARRNNVYNAVFQIENHEVKRLTEDRLIDISSLLKELKQKKSVCLLGDASDICYNTLENTCDFDFNMLKSNLSHINASGVALAAFNKKKSTKFVSAAELSPNYVNLPQAQRELLEKSKLL